jgi:hypothetical protein
VGFAHQRLGERDRDREPAVAQVQTVVARFEITTTSESGSARRTAFSTSSATLWLSTSACPGGTATTAAAM